MSIKSMNLFELKVSDEYNPTCDEYIVTSKDTGQGVYLLGRLLYNGGDYLFEYCDNPPYSIGLHGALDKSIKVHHKEDVCKYLLFDYAPPVTEKLHIEFCEAFGVKSPCTNTWQLFEANWEHNCRMVLAESVPLGDPLGSVLFWRELTGRARNA